MEFMQWQNKMQAELDKLSKPTTDVDPYAKLRNTTGQIDNYDGGARWRV